MSLEWFRLEEVTEDMIRGAITSMKMFKAMVEKEVDDKHPYKATLRSYNLAIEALEKQLPQKPSEDLGIHGGVVYSCRYCGEEISSARWLHDYCPACGQKIDWRENANEKW